MPKKLMGSLRSRNISEVITERIVSAILNGDLRPGDRLPPEDEFAERIGVGKSSVREAIKILVALGVLEIRRGDGTYVVDGFRGSMLDPVVYGILLSERNAHDVIDFKIRVQRMTVDYLFGMPEVKALAKEFPSVSLNEDHHIINELLEEYETRLANCVTNPLVAELYRQAIRIASSYRKFPGEQDEGTDAVVWFGSYLRALAHGASEHIGELLDLELTTLLSTID